MTGRRKPLNPENYVFALCLVLAVIAGWVALAEHSVEALGYCVAFTIGAVYAKWPK